MACYRELYLKYLEPVTKMMKKTLKSIAWYRQKCYILITWIKPGFIAGEAVRRGFFLLMF